MPSVSGNTALIPGNLLSLSYGTRSTEVVNLQNGLIKYGYLAPGLNTGFYGPLTQAAIARYRVAAPSPVSVTSSIPVSPFTRSLKIGMSGSDVKDLQIFLNAQHFTVSSSGPGSPGNETYYYGPATSRAVTKFQEAYASQVLTPNGLTQGTGYFGPATMKLSNSLISNGIK
jgi:peptidoglycan hydrolase-like protein with peptidoglycan-binding domain